MRGIDGLSRPRPFPARSLEVMPSARSLRCSAERSMPMKAAVLRDVAAEPADLGVQIAPLEHLARFAQRQRHHLGAVVAAQRRGRDGADIRRQHVGADRLSRLARRHDQQPVDDVAKLADVARPVIGLQPGQRVGGRYCRGRQARDLGRAMP